MTIRTASSRKRQLLRLQNASTADRETLRVAHFLSLLPISQGAERSLIDFRVQVEISAFLAIQHINLRSDEVLPSLPDLLQSCNVRFSLLMRDTQFSPQGAVQQLLVALQNYTDHSNQTPTAIIGAARSASSEIVSVLGGVYEIPAISGSSTAASLDNKAVAPYFARTIPTNSGDAKALIAYFAMLQVSNFAVLYTNDDYGNYYAQSLSDYANASGLQIELVSFEDSVQSSLDNAVSQLQISRLRYFVGVFSASSWRQVVKSVYKGGIMGRKGYTWYLSDSALEVTQPGFTLKRSSELDLIKALHGTGVVSLSLESYGPFDQALKEFYENTTIQKEFVARHPDYKLFDGYDFKLKGSSSSSSTSLLYQYLTYDAAIGMGLAACNAPPDFNGPELYRSLLNVEFQGVSGVVRFSNVTGTRWVGDVSYSVQNVLALSTTDTIDEVGFSVHSTVQIHPNCSDNGRDCSILVLGPFTYADDTSVPPPPLPPIEQNLNLIPVGIRILGWALCAMVVVVSIGWMAWAYRFRNKDVVRASQPIFLAMLCVGCCIMSLAIIPLGFQEPLPLSTLNAGCMTTPWLLSVGFVLTFSALFSKTWRLNKIFLSGREFRRVRLRPHDVIVPLTAMTLLNIAVLTAWTVIAPLTWSRVQKNRNVDSFGRYLDSYGSCYSTLNEDYRYVFLAAVLAVDVLALVVANYQCYLSRNLPTDFSESLYIALSMAGLLEALILGAPITFLLGGNPTAFFLVLSILICIACLVILLPIFVPKYLRRNLHQQRRAPRRRRLASLSMNFEDYLSSNKTSVHNSMKEEGQQESTASAESTIGCTKVARTAEYYERRNSMSIVGQQSQRCHTTVRKRVAFCEGPTEVSSQSRDSGVSHDGVGFQRPNSVMDDIESISDEMSNDLNNK